MVQLSILSKRFISSKCILIVSLFLSAHGNAQVSDKTDIATDSLQNQVIQEAEIEDTLKVSTFSANIGLGTGNFAFYGDVGRNFSKFNPLVSNLGYSLRISTAFSESIDLSFYSLFGKLTVNERSTNRNLNFQTQIRGGGIDLSYNFKNILGRDRIIYPFISAGVGSFEFLSKTDLYDRNGDLYHYWTDGTIRNLAQTDLNATDAEIMTRDYIYESDLRELNLDNFGDYRERTFAYPIGIGVEMNLDQKLKFRIGTQLYFNQTDLIDNVTDESLGARAGDSKNDRFLFNSFSLSYNISISSKTKEELLMEDLLANSNSDNVDEDGDGIIDFVDNCPHTPENVKVDEFGCPLDGDKDFIPNYRDRELETSEEFEVDTFGMGLSDDYWLQQYFNYQKLWGEPTIVKDLVESGDIPLEFLILKRQNEEALARKAELLSNSKDISFHNRSGRFAVILGSTKNGISEKKSELLLSVPDMQPLEIGDSTYFLTQYYEDLEKAVSRQMSLFIDSVVGQVVEIRDGKVIPLNNEVEQVQEDILHAPETIDKSARGVTFRVQLGAFKSDEELTIYNYIDDLTKLKGDDGLTRYLSGSFNNAQDAAEHRVELLLQGYTGAFLAAYDEGERIELEEVGVEVLKEIDYNKVWNEVNENAFDKASLEFRIIVGKYEGSVPARMLNKFIKYGDVDQLKLGGTAYYLKGHHKTLEEAKIALQDIIKDGLIAAEISGVYKDKLLPVEEVQKMME